MSEKKSVVSKKKKNGTLVAVSLAVLVAVIFYKIVQTMVETEVAPITVPYAIERIDEHTEIKKEMVGFVTIPAKALPSDTVITDPNELLGKYVGTKYTIPQKGFFYRDMLSTLDQIPSRIPKLLDKGQLGLTMRVDLERSVANSLKDNMWVQVRFYTDRTPSNKPVEGILEEKIKILAVRDSTGQDVVKTDQDQTKVPTVIVFDASDEQASYLFRAKNLGELSLVALSEKDEPVVTDSIGSLSNETVNNEAVDQQTESPDESIQKVLEVLGDRLTPEQTELLQQVAMEKKIEEGRGRAFTGNPIKLFIDSMTHNIETQFEDKYFITPKGEVVYFDKELNQLRYFASQEEFKESEYVLQEMTQEEIDQLLSSSSSMQQQSAQTTPEIQQQDSANTSTQNTQTTNGIQAANTTQTKSGVYSGKGKGVTPKLNLQKGIGVISINFQGNGPLVIHLLDSEGKSKKLFEQKTGMFEGKKAFNIPSNGEYIFDIEADGSWSISVEQ